MLRECLPRLNEMSIMCTAIEVHPVEGAVSECARDVFIYFFNAIVSFEPRCRNQIVLLTIYYNLYCVTPPPPNIC